MIDFHSHLLYGIDDGVKTREDSLKALAEYKAAGIDNLVFTPHLYNPYVTTKVKDIRGVYEDLHQEALKIGLRTFLGAELFVRHQELKTIPVLGRYALCEFDVYSQPLGFMDLIDRTLVEGCGYEIIIAHVERYHWLKCTDTTAREMKNRGYLFQMNASDVVGDLDPEAQNWISSGMIDLVATDNHFRRPGAPQRLAEAYGKYPQIAEKMNEIEDGII